MFRVGVGVDACVVVCRLFVQCCNVEIRFGQNAECGAEDVPFAFSVGRFRRLSGDSSIIAAAAP